MPPSLRKIKENTYGALTSISCTSACGGLFKNHTSDFIVGFAENSGYHKAIYAELIGVNKAIEIAKSNNLTHLWLEFDSFMMVPVF